MGKGPVRRAPYASAVQGVILNWGGRGWGAKIEDAGLRTWWREERPRDRVSWVREFHRGWLRRIGRFCRPRGRGRRSTGLIVLNPQVFLGF